MRFPKLPSGALAIAIIAALVVSGSFLQAGEPQLEMITLLGVRANPEVLPGDPGGPVPPAAAASPAAPAPPDGDCAGARMDELRRVLHPGGQQRTALIVRGGRYGIHRYHQALLGRLATAFDGDPRMQAFLDSTFRRDYLSDEVELTRRLEAAGYRVELKASSSYGNDAARFKEDVLATLRRPETTVLIFFGHGNDSGMVLMDSREHAAPGPDEMAARLVGDQLPHEGLSVEDIAAARGATKLDAILLQCCQGGLGVYAHEKYGRDGTTFADCVKPDTGFFAGWVTYATYFTPQTTAMLDAFFCHALNGPTAAPADRARSARYFVKSGPLLRKLALIASLDDRAAISGEGVDFARFEADPDVHERNEAQIAGIEALEAFFGLVYDLKVGTEPLASDVRRFVTAYYRYLDAYGIDRGRTGAGAPPTISNPPTTPELNAVIRYNARPILASALESLLPGLVLVQRGNAHLEDSAPSKLFFDLSIEVRNSEHLDDFIAIFRTAYEARARQGLEAAHGDIGPQLAERLRTTLDNIRARFPSTLVSVRTTFDLEKIVHEGGNRFRPVVSGYNVAIGEVPPEQKASKASPYEVHVGLASLTTIGRAVLEPMLGSEVELKAQVVPPSRFTPNFDVYAYLRMTRLDTIGREDDTTLSVPMSWQLRVNWGRLFGDGFAYADTTLKLGVRPVSDLKVHFDPTVEMRLGSGWPAPGWLKDPIAARASSYITQKIQEKTADDVDFGQFIPPQAADEILGRVRIGRIKVEGGTLSVYIDHVE